jgi:L-alanine-DL-glutamate epimerase-like enolase superfamily enzyme
VTRHLDAPITGLEVAAYTVPTEAPESDGTLQWSDTTMVVVHLTAGGCRGVGYTYATAGCVPIVHDLLEDEVVGRDALDVPGIWHAMVRRIRNLGRPGVASTAIAAVDTAAWDLKAKLLELPLFRLLGPLRDEVPIYGSGGFTSYDLDELTAQLGGWVHDDGIPRVKMKIAVDFGRDPAADVERARVVRGVIGEGVQPLVDANGAYDVKTAIAQARAFEALGVVWFEEPVTSDDLAGLRAVRDATTVEVAAGEYGYDLTYFERMLAAGAVDVLQADVSRCAGITDWLRVAALAAGRHRDVSGHCAPMLHVHPACAVANLRHLEYFHDHVRLEHLLLDGVLSPVGGTLRPDPDRPGMGIELKTADAERWRRA